MQYVLLIYTVEETLEAAAGRSNAPLTSSSVDDLERRGILVEARNLYGSESATTIHVDGEDIITGDEASTPPGEHLTGVYVVEVDDLDQAITAAANLPGARTGWIEIRPVVPASTSGGCGHDV